ncbi:ATP-dependent helicase C-terminal domain-containing protein [Roseococcus sp.]|uniref:ATP-dependent helicase C-terminal domain-containing protein n=1 Tax=Roseococcus sp. TaxID=2109646 RepID=UPI003BA8EE0D
MHALEGAPWPDMSDAALAATAKDWLAPYCAGMTKLSELKSLNIGQMLLPHDLRRRLDAALPARIELPQGRSAGVDYAGEIPTLEARAQHLYGMGGMPPLAEGRIRLQVALLSAGGAADRHHGGSSGVLLGRGLGRCPQGHARPLPLARLAREAGLTRRS